MLLDKLNGRKILLASNSPRRRELLKMLRVPFTSVSLEGLDESFPCDMDPMEVAKYIAEKKSVAYRSHIAGDEIIITADTVVICEKQIMGKPADATEAKKMLKFLSDKVHQVATGVTIADKEKSVSFVCITDVEFGRLTTDEIDYYVDNFQPYDKAGAYGIQEWIGAVAVKGIVGSYFNVMGLPVHLLYHHLNKFL